MYYILFRKGDDLMWGFDNSTMNCCICGKTQGKYVLKGLNGKICDQCQKNISNIRSGHLAKAKAYFANIQIQSDMAQKFIEKQYTDYSSVECQDIADELLEEQKKLELQREQDLANFLLTTTSNLDGYKIKKYIDIVYSEVIYSINVFKSVDLFIKDSVDNFHIFSDKELRGTTELIQEAKNYAKRDLVKKAMALGANAVIGIDIESSLGSGTNGAARVSINGTAVIVEKEIE